MRFDQTLRRRGLWSIVVGLGLVFLAGCGGKAQYPVHGKLVYADNEEPVKELADFEVIFTSESLGVSARGTIQQDGTFQLGTIKETDGAPAGEYIVTLTQPYREPERPYVGDRVVDPAYEDPDTSDLKAEVKAEKNDFVFKLRRIEKKKK
ncbi:MAG: hypothetical protein L0241_27160 [Planctomycetia bacterium]|nr:hypothetical protein [Planctomycetia bacterium]